jgi:hypothetical protein
MPSRDRPKLTPKVAALVATDRLRRPPLGRLTPTQAAQLLEVARGEQAFDEPVSAPRAIVALAAGRPEMAMPLLEELLSDVGRPPTDRRAAAEGLGHVASPEAERVLLGAARDRDPRVQQAVFKSLGLFGGPDVVRELAKIQARDEHARRQLTLTQALVAHRHGLPEGPFLPEAPAGRTRLTARSATTDFEITAMAQEAIAAERARMHGPTYGIRLAGWGLSVRCGGSEWTVLVNAELGRTFGSFARLADRPWIAAVLALRYPVGVRSTTQYVVLTRPESGGAHLDVVRADGEAVYVGRAPIEAATTTFSVSDVERPGTAPVRVSGRISEQGVELEQARAAPRRVNTRTSADVTA